MKRKASRIDYSKASLPRTRRAQFKDCFKMNFGLVAKCGLMLMAFLSPMIVFSFFAEVYLISIYSNTEEALNETVAMWHLLFNAGLVLFIIPASLGLTGCVKVMRNLIWGEGIYFKQDFFGAIKENGLRNALISFVFGILYWISYSMFIFFADTVVAYFSLLLIAFVFLPICLWIILLNNTYSYKTWDLIKNGIYFYIKTIGWTLLGAVMMILPVAFTLIPIELYPIKYGAMIIILVFYFPIAILTMVLFSADKFDQYINKEHFPDYYHKGLNAD